MERRISMHPHKYHGSTSPHFDMADEILRPRAGTVGFSPLPPPRACEAFQIRLNRRRDLISDVMG